jgi:hypothetical protein
VLEPYTIVLPSGRTAAQIASCFTSSARVASSCTQLAGTFTVVSRVAGSAIRHRSAPCWKFDTLRHTGVAGAFVV